MVSDGVGRIRLESWFIPVLCCMASTKEHLHLGYHARLSDSILTSSSSRVHTMARVRGNCANYLGDTQWLGSLQKSELGMFYAYQFNGVVFAVLNGFGGGELGPL